MVCANGPGKPRLQLHYYHLSRLQELNLAPETIETLVVDLGCRVNTTKRLAACLKVQKERYRSLLSLSHIGREPLQLHTQLLQIHPLPKLIRLTFAF